MRRKASVPERHHACYDRRVVFRTALLGLLVVSAACGSSRQKNPDGGDTSLTFPDALAAGRHAFDVIAVLHADGSVNLPPTNKFTLVLDVDARVAIAGGNGAGAVVPVETADGRTFVLAAPFIVRDSTPDPCGAPEDVHYEHVEVVIGADGSLTGQATGVAYVSCGDCSFGVPFAAPLTGTADKTPPTLGLTGLAPATPFDAFGLAVSEPLPATATARLLADDGEAFDLLPQIREGDIPLVAAFLKPNVILRAGQGYVLTLDGLVDFAGLVDTAGPPLRFASFAAAPTVAEDGFEAVTDSALGGAMVMTDGVLPAIAGRTSLYIGGAGALGLDATNGRALMVRLARQAGDTKLRFSCRAVATAAQTPFYGTVRVGSEGGSVPSMGVAALGDPAGATEMVDVGGRPAFLTPIASFEVALPADSADVVLVSITPVGSVCRFPGTNPGTGLLIDDLRLE